LALDLSYNFHVVQTFFLFGPFFILPAVERRIARYDGIVIRRTGKRRRAKK
jgi:hypothetical protein